MFMFLSLVPSFINVVMALFECNVFLEGNLIHVSGSTGKHFSGNKIYQWTAIGVNQLSLLLDIGDDVCSYNYNSTINSEDRYVNKSYTWYNNLNIR